MAERSRFVHSVYLVDGDPLIIENPETSVLWMDNGFEVVGSSTDPFRAVEEIMQCRPDVVFSDLKMPLMSGIQLIKALRGNDLQCDFVMLSAFGSFEDARSFFLLDGFDYLLKPFNQSDAEIVLERLSRKLVKRHAFSQRSLFRPPATPSLTSWCSM